MQGARRIQRRTNMEAILYACLDKPCTVAELAKNVGVTRPAAESVVADLISLGWLDTAKPAESSTILGRPATYYGLSPKAGKVLSFDIGAHHLSVAAASLSGEVVFEKTVAVSEALNIEERLEKAISLVHQIVLPLGTVHACVVATPGIHNDGIVSYYGGNGLPGLQGFELREFLAERMQIPIFTAGDCALGAHGETWCGAASGRQHVVFIMASRRTGAASIIDGRVHGGYSGAAGLIGELPVLRWRELESECFAKVQYPQGQPKRDELFQLAQTGDLKAKKAAREYAHVLAQGTSAMILAVAPEVVVIGGRYSVFADLFLADFITELKNICPFMPEIQVSQLGSRAVVLGGLRFALDLVFDSMKYCVLHTEFFPSAQKSLADPIAVSISKA